MRFSKLLESQVKDARLKKAIVRLLEEKIAGHELRKGHKIKIINDYLEENFSYLENYLRKYKLSKNSGIDRLDNLFRNVLKEVW